MSFRSLKMSSTVDPLRPEMDARLRVNETDEKKNDHTSHANSRWNVRTSSGITLTVRIVFGRCAEKPSMSYESSGVVIHKCLSILDKCLCVIFDDTCSELGRRWLKLHNRNRLNRTYNNASKRGKMGPRIILILNECAYKNTRILVWMHMRVWATVISVVIY